MVDSFPCECSEKAIMACKARLMGDVETFKKILECKEPAKVKAFGRQVKPWNDKAWNKNVMAIA